MIFENIKTRYEVIIAILLIISIIVGIIVFKNTPEGEDPYSRVFQIPSLIIALIAALIALAIADPKTKRVLIDLKIEIEDDGSNYKKISIHFQLKQKYYSDFPEDFKDYKYKFRMINNSGFDLKNPQFTFFLPENKQHPIKNGNDRFYNTNLFNVPKNEIVTFFVEDKIIISKQLFPFWHMNKEITIWIRMVDNMKLEPFNVDVSVNCDNAEGWTKSITIDPKKLLNKT